MYLQLNTLRSVFFITFCSAIDSGRDTSAPTYDDPIVFKKKKASGPELDEDGYINTSKCIAYRPNASGAITSSTSQQYTAKASSPVDEYEVMMRQLTFRGNV